jgi:hypothetical protein
MLASDLANPEFANPQDPDARLHVEIFRQPIKNEFESTKEGRAIFGEVVMISIQVPGDATTKVVQPLREDHKMRFPRHWAYFESTQGKEALEVGTPLSQWPLLGPAQVEELRALKFRTVEQIAGASDQQLQRMGAAGGLAGTALRDKAQRYLAVARDASVVDHAAEELAKIRAEQAEKDAKHAADLAAMQAKLDAVIGMMAEQTERKKPGRPAKAEKEAA